MTRVYAFANYFSKVRKTIKDHRILFAIILITILAGMIRLYKLGDHSLWYDEVASIEHLKSISDYDHDDPWGLFAFTKTERLPPLYFLLLNTFYNLKNNEWGLRLPSVIFGIASIPIMYLVCNQIANQGVALIATMLLAFSPFHIFYSREIRPYPLFMLFTLLAFLLYHLALQKHKNEFFWGLIFIISLGIYTHTYMILVLLLLDLWFVLGWKTNRVLLSKWFFCHLSIGIICTPALFLLIYHIGRGNVTLVNYPPGLRSLAGTFYVFTFGRHFFTTLQNLPFIIAQCFILGYGMLAGIKSLWEDRTETPEQQSQNFVLSAVGIYFIIWLISISIKPLFDEARIHYLIFLFPVYLFIVAKGFSCISNKKLKIFFISAALIISFISNHPSYFQYEIVGKGNFRAAATFIQDYHVENKNIYHTNYMSTLPIDYYLNWNFDQVYIDTVKNTTFSDEDEFWLVIYRTTGAFEYVRNIFEQQRNPLTEKLSSDSICTSTIDDLNFVLVHSTMYPGKNYLSVCMFQRKVP